MKEKRDVDLSSSHTLKKDPQGYVFGDIRVYVQNYSKQEISSVTVTLKSDNQPDKILAEWDTIGKPISKRSTDRIDLDNVQYPIIVCTYTYYGESYSETYSYY